MKKCLILGAILLAAGLLVAACSGATPAPQTVEVPVTVEVPKEVPVEVTRVVEVTAEPVAPVAEAPFVEAWQASAHADATAEAFTHWNEADPKEVPVDCAKCHSGTGFQDFVGADGSAEQVVDKAQAVGSVIDCQTCHNAATLKLSSVTFPSGAVIDGLGAEARCMTCHQGRASQVQLNAAFEKAGVAGEDAVDTASDKLGFTNIHYFAAAVTRYGTEVKGGYEYPGKDYDVLFDHVPGMQKCQDCHDPHSLQVKVDTCAACHAVKTVEDLRTIRMQSSQVDYDADGDVKEGIDSELTGVREKLLAGIQAYATNISGQAIAYSPTAYPYFFKDTNGDGQVGDDEAKNDNKFAAWSPRLLKAAYNYQMSVKDPGAFAHGGKYIIELMFDSLEDLNAKLADKAVDMTGMHRVDAGHFAGSEEPFRHWDEEGAVPAGCAKCHSSTGLPQFIRNGANVAVPPSNGFWCETCHTSVQTFERYQLKDVTFPSGAKLTFGENADANLCIMCHQGRESTVSVDKAIAGAKVGDDEVSDKLAFRNVHYFAAGATLFGGEAKGAYQYADQTYVGKFEHGGIGPATCVDCHSTHGLQVQVDTCGTCHKTVKSEEDLAGIRMDETDYDGDGDTTEGILGEIETMQEALYASIQAYAKDTAGTAIIYSASAYPYWFIDANANGQADEGEMTADTRYATWTPRLLRAAYNYQYAQKDPGKFAHNAKYILQVLYDSLKDTGADVSKMTRPAGPAQ